MKMDDWGGKPTIFGNTQIHCRLILFVKSLVSPIINQSIRRAEAADVADVASPAGSGPPMGLSR